MPREYSPYAIFETTFLLGDPRYKKLRATAKVLYIALWARAFQDRRDVLPDWYDVGAMCVDTSLDARSIRLGVVDLIQNCLIEQLDGGRIKVLGARDKGNIKWKEVVNSLPQSMSKKRREEKRREEKTVKGAEFEVFWKAYPRKVGKQPAQKAWTKLNPDDELLSKILKALEWQSSLPDWLKEKRKFCPHASTYLNQARWTDEPPEETEAGGEDARPAKQRTCNVECCEVCKDWLDKHCPACPDCPEYVRWNTERMIQEAPF